MEYLRNKRATIMKKIMLFLISLSLISGLSAEPQEIVIINYSDINFNKVDNQSEFPFIIQKGDFDAMISEGANFLISNKKWTDEQIADYKKSHQSLPIMLIIAGYSDLNEVSISEKTEIFSTRAGNELLYFYVNESQLEGAREAIALHFSETLQPWFDENGLMPIPKSIQHQNRVELGLSKPIFLGGYK
jgi:hypothetical protein